MGVDNVRMLKLLQIAHDSGLNIEYRCIKCRNCSDCKKPLITEKISLHEEAEDQEIYNSVSIDYEKKKIVCRLPLRGKETDFLTNNRDIAKKVLNQQCKKYHKDVTTKDTILKAFAKLFVNKYAMLWDELTEEQKEMLRPPEERIKDLQAPQPLQQRIKTSRTARNTNRWASKLTRTP